MLVSFRGLGRNTTLYIAFLLTVQILSAGFIAREFLSNAFDWQIRTVSPEMRESLEILCSFTLLLGVVGSILLVVAGSKHILRVNTQLDAAAGEFQTHIERQFAEWHLTPSEKGVALLVIKGFSNGEIAKLRGTTQSTIKSQVTSIFRKAKLTSRLQLVVCVIEDVVTAIPDDEHHAS